MSLKKLWKIEVSDTLTPEVQKIIRKVLKPDSSVAGNPGKCIFCGEETTWTINEQYVCPRCSGKYGFINPDYLPDPCEVCGAQGEWVCGANNEHSLCFRHRDAWYDFTRSELNMAAYNQASKADRSVAWDKCFADFIQSCRCVKKEDLTLEVTHGHISFD